MTQGDVNFAVIIAVAIAIVLCSTMVLFTIVFPVRVSLMRASIIDLPVKTGIIGGIVAFGSIGGGLALSNAPQAFVKILGFAIAGWAIIHGILGSSALCEEVGARIAADMPQSKTLANAKASAMLVGTGLIPIVGWGVFFPVMLGLSIGASLSVRGQKRRRLAVTLDT